MPRGLSILYISVLGLTFVVGHDTIFVFFILLGIQRTLNRPIWTNWERVTLPGKTGFRTNVA